MLSSIDGRIDGASLKGLTPAGEYEATGTQLNGDAWICGRVTMQQHFAAPEPFRAASDNAAGPQPVHVARRADSYAVAVDTVGKLRWSSADIDGDHLISVLSERVSADYLALLREWGVSYIVAGETRVDLVRAVNLLGEHFGIRRLLLEGGGHINGAFLEAGLVDELSLLVAPGIDGRHHIPAVFDGLSPTSRKAFPLSLKSVERREGDILWLRYEREAALVRALKYGTSAPERNMEIKRVGPGLFKKDRRCGLPALFGLTRSFTRSAKRST
jgi:riboflavin biosynthesis pyrimidine reductase